MAKDFPQVSPNSAKSKTRANLTIPCIKGSGNTRKEYDAHQGERKSEGPGEAEGSRKPGQ